MFGWYLNPFFHGMPSTRGIKQPRAGECKRLCMPGGLELEGHGALVESGEGLAVVLEAGHAKHLSANGGRCGYYFGGDCVVLGAWV